MSILNEIYNYKLDFVAHQKNTLSQKEIEKEIITNSDTNFVFKNKLNCQSNKFSIIGELKKASPSLGEFVKSDVNLIELAQIYEKSGISCLSILTDEKYFNGKLIDLKQIKKNTSIPILRKDFIVDEYQIYESKFVGADCILIILSMLNQKDAKRFTDLANELGLDTIIEVHNTEELKRSDKISSEIIGINNRNLNNFITDINTTIKLSKEVKQSEKILVSESGFQSKQDINKIYTETGINKFLIGEYLMKSNNLSSLIEDLLN